MGHRIKVVIPNSSIEFRDSQIEERKKAAAPGNEVEVICLAHGPVSIEAAYDEALAASTEEVELATRTMLEQMASVKSYIPASSCGIPGLTPQENIDAFTRTVRSFNP